MQIGNCKLNGVSISRLAGQDVLRTDLWQSVASGRVDASLPICNLQWAFTPNRHSRNSSDGESGKAAEAVISHWSFVISVLPLLMTNDQ